VRFISGSWNPATVSALAAIFGSLTGALASSVSTWITQRHQDRRDILAKRIFQREQLYSECISESAHSMADAIQHNLHDPDKLIPAYALLSRLRLSSSPDVLASAEQVIQHILTTYSASNLSPEEIQSRGRGSTRIRWASSAIFAVPNLKRCRSNCDGGDCDYLEVVNMAQTHATLVPQRLHSGTYAELRQSFPSRLQAIQVSVDELMRFILDFRNGDGSETDIEIALREALANAVVHGNGENSCKRVYVECRCYLDGEVSITVRDEGRGFDKNTVPDPTTPENRLLTRGRGIYLMEALMDEVSFEDNGAVVHMRKKSNVGQSRTEES